MADFLDYVKLPNRDLDAVLAEKLFGWVWYVDTKRNSQAFYPPKEGGRIRNNFSPSFRPVSPNEEFERFADWDRAAMRYEDDGRLLASGLPYYSTDIKPAWEIVDNLVSLNWQPTLAIRQFQKYLEDRYIFHGVRLVNHPDKTQEFQSFSWHAESAPRAICLGALQSLTAKSRIREKPL